MSRKKEHNALNIAKYMYMELHDYCVMNGKYTAFENE